MTLYNIREIKFFAPKISAHFDELCILSIVEKDISLCIILG